MSPRTKGSADSQKSGTIVSMEENLKKAVSEMLVLSLLREKDMYVNEMLDQMAERSQDVYVITFPYALLYRLERFGYLGEVGKRIAEDGRRRQYYQITDKGREYLVGLTENYERLSAGIHRILQPASEPNKD